MKKILIVDDQQEIREVVYLTLRAEDYLIFQAENGEEALEIARHEKPDLILMDIMLSGELDGLEATRRLKSDPETSGSPVIMLTSRGTKEDVEKGFAAGADGYFIKPFSPLELIAKIEEVLGEE